MTSRLLPCSSSQHVLSDNKSVPPGGTRKQAGSWGLGNPLEGSLEKQGGPGPKVLLAEVSETDGGTCPPHPRGQTLLSAQGKGNPWLLPVAPGVRMCNSFLAPGVQTAWPTGECASPFNPRHGLGARSRPFPRCVPSSWFRQPPWGPGDGTGSGKSPRGGFDSQQRPLDPWLLLSCPCPAAWLRLSSRD